VLTLLLEMDLPDVVNDLDIDFASNPEAAMKVRNDRRNLRKIREVVASTTVNIMNPLREGKSLLVLDLDYSGHHPGVPVHKLTASQLFWTPNHSPQGRFLLRYAPVRIFTNFWKVIK
jgi:hypothetical protein